jgi:hypothetical protein
MKRKGLGVRKGSKVKFKIITAMKPKKKTKWVDGIVDFKFSHPEKQYGTIIQIKRGHQKFIKRPSQVKKR